MNSTPPPFLGLRHVALFIQQFEASEHFYVNILQMKVDWRPDADNLYLSSGSDNLALHRAAADFNPSPQQRLDHFGFFVQNVEDVDIWHAYLSKHGIKIQAAPKNHRDGTRSFYCSDPDGNTIQVIFVPTK